jgi:adenylate kinase
MAINTVILFGRPGSGKGTQGKVLAEAHGWIHFSTGEQFRMLREEESVLGARVREIYDSGKLLPDWFATYLFEKAILNVGHEAGIVCEGYPRSLTQAETFDSITAWLQRPYVVIDLEVSDEEVTARMLKRSEQEHRPDSGTEEQIKTRLATYHEHTAPVLAYFKERGMLRSVDGMGTPEEVAEAIRAVLA